MNVTLPPFRAVQLCRKCEHDDINTTHHPANKWRSRYTCSLVEQARTSFPPEHLCRRCRRCGYSWAEAVLIPEEAHDRSL